MLNTLSVLNTTPHSDAGKKVKGSVDWDCFVAVAEIGKDKYPVVFKIRTIDQEVRSQIYEMSTKKETDGSHDPGQDDVLHGMSDYGVVPSISENKIAENPPAVKNQVRSTTSNRWILHIGEGLPADKSAGLRMAREISQETLRKM